MGAKTIGHPIKISIDTIPFGCLIVKIQGKKIPLLALDKDIKVMEQMVWEHCEKPGIFVARISCI